MVLETVTKGVQTLLPVDPLVMLKEVAPERIVEVSDAIVCELLFLTHLPACAEEKVELSIVASSKPPFISG